MNHTYYFHRYLSLLCVIGSTFNVIYFCSRLRRESMARYLTLEYTRKLNIRSIALWSFFCYGILLLFSGLFIAISKYSHGYFLNIFTQRIAPAPSLFFAHGNYVLYHIGVSIAILGNSLKSCFLFLMLALYLPQAVVMLKDRSKAHTVLTFGQYKGLVVYGLLRLAVAPLLIIFLPLDDASDFDYALFLNTILFCIECIAAGTILKGISSRLDELAEGDGLDSFSGIDLRMPARRPSALNQPSVPYSDPILLDNGVEDNPVILFEHLAASSRYCYLSILVEGLALLFFTLFLGLTSNKDAYPFIRDFLSSFLYVFAIISSFLIGLTLIPLKRLQLVLEQADTVRLTNLESMFWKPSLFLMDREWRDRMRQERIRRLANVQNLTARYSGNSTNSSASRNRSNSPLQRSSFPSN